MTDLEYRLQLLLEEWCESHSDDEIGDYRCAARWLAQQLRMQKTTPIDAYTEDNTDRYVHSL